MRTKANKLKDKIRLLKGRINNDELPSIVSPISFLYNDESTPRRGFPYTYGLFKNTNARDEEAVRIYLTEKGQSETDFIKGVSGANSNKKDPSGKNWRVIYLSKMKDVAEEIAEDFEVHSTYKKSDSFFSRIDKEVENL